MSLPEYWKEYIKIPPEQREGQIWSLEQKQTLIDSIYNSFDIPKVYFRQDSKKPNIWYLIDGQQRLTTILDFLHSKFPLSSEDSTIPKHMQGKYFRSLKVEDKEKIRSFNLDAIWFTPSDETEEEDMFLRLNNGTPLNAAEKRNAIQGEFRDSIKTLVGHIFFKKKVNFPDKRYAYQAIAAQLSLLALREGPTNLKGADLKRAYTSHRTYPERVVVEAKVKRILNFMGKVFPDKEPFMKKKFYIISAFCLLMQLDDNYALSTIAPTKIYKFFEDFENKRYENTQKTDEDSGFNPELASFYDKTVNSPDSEDSVKTRHQILIKYFLATFENLEMKDDQRLFSEEQKLAIYYIAKGICAGVRRFSCPHTGKRIAIEAGEFDHIKEFTRGGKTIVSNGQFLCKKCHSHKTANRPRS